MEFSQEKFDQIKQEAELFYRTIGNIRCPYFNEEVHFNNKGWEHLLSKSWDRGRSDTEQFSRLRHLNVVPEILKLSRTLQGIRRIRRFEHVKMNNKWCMVMKNVNYYEFISVIESHLSLVRLKVIIKQIEGGEKYFLSAIPFWKTDKTTGERILSYGNLEED